jgi:hypothetical protein
MSRLTWLAIALLLPSAATAAFREVALDSLTSAQHWQVGGNRINYTLGESRLEPVTSPTREGFERSLRLTYDFRDPQRYYLSAYHTGPAIRGVCREVTVWVYSDGSGRALRAALEDARGRWFERDLGALGPEGWQQLRVPVGDGVGWRGLLRRGEKQLPILPPVNLRQVSVLAKPDAPPQGSICLSDLRATCDVVPADDLGCAIAPERPNRLYERSEGGLAFWVSNSGPAALSFALSWRVVAWDGTERGAGGREVTLPAGMTTEEPAAIDALEGGSYTLTVQAKTEERTREWSSPFAVVEPQPERPADPNARFGLMFNLGGFGGEEAPVVARLNRDAGIRWTRVGFGWGEINPAPGVWAWDGPPRVEGPLGRAVDLQGRVYRVPHQPLLNCPEAVTIAFWARGTGNTGNWQFPLTKWGAGPRNYGVYFHRDTGRFTFSASYERMPAGGWHDVSCDFSAWDGQWRHYAASYSAADRKVSLYVDGALKTSADHDGGELWTNEDDLAIGSGCPAPLDEFVLYNRALADDEVARLAAKDAPPSEGLVAHWAFDDIGPTLADASGHGLDLAAGEPSGVREARLALTQGMKTLGLLGFPPEWASTAPPGAERPWVYKPNLDAWADFVEQTTRHYADLVQHWEIWNEPNITVFWEPTPDPREFLDVLRVGYEAAKRGNPTCTVLMPGLAGPTENRWGMDFLDELLELGGARYCDAISIHPYRQSTPEESDLVGDLRHIADLAAANGGRRPIWYTENCWTTQIPGGSTEDRQALMLPRCYVLSLATGLVDKLLWFRLHDSGVDRFYSEDNYGMCHHDLTPKPAWFAHRTLARLLEGAEPDGEWDIGPQSLARIFRTPEGRVAALWCPSGSAPVSVFVGAPTVTRVDLMGREEQLATQDGVLLLEATEAVQYLTDLPAQAEGRGAIVRVETTQLVRGAEGKLVVPVRNPFGGPRPVEVNLQTEGSSLSLPEKTRTVRVPANGQAQAEFLLSCAPDAAPGWVPVQVSATVDGRTFTSTGQVAVRTALPDAGPVGYWKLDEGQGTVIRDSSPNGNDGTVDQPQWVEGKIGTALQFDGQHIAEIPDAPSLNLADEVTLAFWLKVLAETGTWQFPVTKYLNENVRRNYGIYLHNQKLYPCFSASFEGGGYLHTDIASNVPINDGQWHHVAAGYSLFDRRVRMYVDGKMVVDRPFDEGAMLFAETPLRLGVGTVGVIDEVKVYPRALRPEEAAELAQ